jgi:hypothetical protein
VRILCLAFLLLCVSSAQRAAAFKALTTWKTWTQIPSAIANSMQSLMDQANARAVTFRFGQSDYSDDITVRAYVGGYAMGFTTEQINVATNGTTNVTHLKVNTGAASWSSTSRNKGGKVPHIYSSERSKTRATHIQSCPGQPRKNSIGLFHRKSPGSTELETRPLRLCVKGSVLTIDTNNN